MKTVMVVIIIFSVVILSCKTEAINNFEIKISITKINYSINDTIKCDIYMKNNTEKNLVLLNLHYLLGEYTIQIVDENGNNAILGINYPHRSKLISINLGRFGKEDFMILKKGEKNRIRYEAQIRRAKNIYLLFPTTEYFIRELQFGNELTFSVKYDINKIPRLLSWIEKKGKELFPEYEFLEYAESSNSVTIKIND